MEKSELRLGNLITYNGYDYTVKTIEENYITVEEIDEEIEYFDAVDLSDEYLDKFGFKKASNSLYKYLELAESLYIMIDHNRNAWIAQYSSIDHYAIQITKLEYVHQLQNLHFFMAFANNELKIKN